MADALKTLVVGTGDMARKHLDAYAQVEEVSLRGIVGRSKEKASLLADEYGVESIYTSLEEALGAERFDIASVCLPTSLHPAVTIELLEAGTHVLTEKPIALSMEDGRRMIHAAQKNQRKLSVVFNRRFSSGFDEVRDKLESLGSPLLYRVEDLRGMRPKRAMHDIEQNGGPVIDCACHDFDLLLRLFGRVETVYATGYVYADSDVVGYPPERLAVDTSSIQLRFSNGYAADIFYSWGLPERDAYWIRRNFIGPEGVVVAVGDFGERVEYFRRDGIGQVADSFVPDGHRRQIAAFVEAVADGGKVPVEAEEAMEALQLSLLALESIRSGEIMRVDRHKGEFSP